MRFNLDEDEIYRYSSHCKAVQMIVTYIQAWLSRICQAND